VFNKLSSVQFSSESRRPSTWIFGRSWKRKKGKEKGRERQEKEKEEAKEGFVQLRLREVVKVMDVPIMRIFGLREMISHYLL